MIWKTDASTSTLSRSDTGLRAAPPPGKVPHLFVALECERPLVPPSGYSLADVDEVLIGRGTERSAVRVVEGGRRRLSLTVPDARTSSVHARLERVLDRWVVEDANSKNGILHNGVRQKRAALASGDLLELGHTFLLFSELPPHTGPTREELGPTPVEPLAPELSTFLPELARDLGALVRVARSSVAVLLQGETGTGKEVIARAIHSLSGRTGPFVPVNCGALPEALIASELFGHRKGAFTGATEDRPGLVRAAAGGTLFLDEIGDLPLPLQAAFLRVLQEGEVLPLGSAQPVKVDLRVVSATHRDLAALVERERFRSDLYSRLSGLTVRLPLLRERREDLGLLIAALLPRVAPGAPDRVTFGTDAARALFAYGWPLNVRELEKSLSVAAVLAGGGRIELEHLPAPLRGALPSLGEPRRPPPVPEGRPLGDADLKRRDQLIGLLREHRGNVSAVARALGLARMQIQRWLKRYRIAPESFRG